MALIKCKNCQHEISDKATSCPTCGADLVEQDDVVYEIVVETCEDCGKTLEQGEIFCSKCGCPVQSKELIKDITTEDLETEVVVSEKQQKSKKPIIFGVLAVVVVAIVVIISMSILQNKSKFDEHYLEIDEEISSAMLEISEMTRVNTTEVVFVYTISDEASRDQLEKIRDDSYSNPQAAEQFEMTDCIDIISTTRETLEAELNDEYSEEYLKYINENIEYLDELEELNNCLTDYVVNVNISALNSISSLVSENTSLKIFNTRKDFITNLVGVEKAKEIMNGYEDAIKETYSNKPL